MVAVGAGGMAGVYIMSSDDVGLCLGLRDSVYMRRVQHIA